MKLISAKNILSEWSSGEQWFGINYGMNIYRGCCHGCIYCDSRSECYHVENFDEVCAKENAINIIDRELRSKRRKGIVGTGAMSDPYNPFEKKYELTRGALELVNRYGFGLGLITKSSLAVRDIDLFLKIKQHSPTMVALTITTYDDNLCSKIEPNVASSSERFNALKQLSQAGIFTGVLIGPILPFINDTEENIRLLIETAAECGAKFVVPYLAVTLRQNQRDYFYEKLDTSFPGVKQKYIKTFGYSYQCASPDSQKLWDLIVSLCRKHGLVYRMPDVINALKLDYRQEQITFLDGIT